MKLEIKGIRFNYGSRPALNEVTFSVKGGEVLGFVGPNGSGKTTLIKCIDRILKPKAGSVLMEGKETNKLGPKERSQLMAYVPQSAHSVFAATVFDTVLLGRKPYITWGLSQHDKEVVSDAISLMGLEEYTLRQFNELSGGERQKVLITRALVQEPELLLLDEPTSNLDMRHQIEVLNVIRWVAKAKGITVLMVLHDLNLASRFSDRVVMLKEGKVWDSGTPAEVLTAVNIRQVYGIEATIFPNSGYPYIIPLEVCQAEAQPGNGRGREDYIKDGR
ncbi:ABC transporter ATP-binding protein [Dehalococcoidia bacterium]|nr:ABC transporter ATP-binding protein [Dehalococcoidia bacterium]